MDNNTIFAMSINEYRKAVINILKNKIKHDDEPVVTTNINYSTIIAEEIINNSKNNIYCVLSKITPTFTDQILFDKLLMNILKAKERNCLLYFVISESILDNFTIPLVLKNNILRIPTQYFSISFNALVGDFSSYTETVKENINTTEFEGIFNGYSNLIPNSVEKLIKKILKHEHI